MLADRNNSRSPAIENAITLWVGCAITLQDSLKNHLKTPSKIIRREAR
ncbi:MAG: hypothetical protein ACFB0D_20470 [Phormidesmis sp.]